jgi:hypothetical protein
MASGADGIYPELRMTSLSSPQYFTRPVKRGSKHNSRTARSERQRRLFLLPRVSFRALCPITSCSACADVLFSRCHALAFSVVRLSAPAVAFAVAQELSQMFCAVENAGADAKESNASGFTGAKKGDASDA